MKLIFIGMMVILVVFMYTRITKKRDRYLEKNLDQQVLEPVWICHKCGEMFQLSADHTPMHCPWCRSSDLVQDLKEKGRAGYIHICPICGKIFCSCTTASHPKLCPHCGQSLDFN